MARRPLRNQARCGGTTAVIQPAQGNTPDPGPSDRSARQLHPLPRGLVELYGLLAVLVVLVPEWMAEGALWSWSPPRRNTAIPPASSAWRNVPELRLASMNLSDLRLLAAELRLSQYASLRRERLSARLLRRLKRRKAL